MKCFKEKGTEVIIYKPAIEYPSTFCGNHVVNEINSFNAKSQKAAMAHALITCNQKSTLAKSYAAIK